MHSVSEALGARFSWLCWCLVLLNGLGLLGMAAEGTGAHFGEVLPLASGTLLFWGRPRSRSSGREGRGFGKSFFLHGTFLWWLFFNVFQVDIRLFDI